MRGPTREDVEAYESACDDAADRHVQHQLDHPEDFCACGRELITETEQRNRVCRECL